MPYADPDMRRKYAREWRAARRMEFFNGKVCVECGSTDSLQLDHIDPTQKVSHKIWSWSRERRDFELSKCQVLCSECHDVKTRSQYPITHGVAVHGSRSMYSKGCRCRPCRDANAKSARDWRHLRTTVGNHEH